MLRSEIESNGERVRILIPLKEHARDLEPQSGAATTAAAAAAGVACASRRRWLTRWIISIPALGAIAGLAGNNPAEPPRRAETAQRQVTRAESVPSLAIVTRQANRPAAAPATDAHLDTAPPRNAVGLELIRNGWIYNCMECHTLLGAKWHYDRPLNEHRDIDLAHGNNRFCLNCHHPSNRTAFVDYDGAEIAQGDTVQLCAKCHGTIFRDWQAGVHGRQNGYWRAQAGVKKKLRCIECHDPHQPKFPDLKPLAPLRYPPRAAGSTVSSFGFRVSGSIAFSTEPTRPKAEFTAAFNPKLETRNPKPSNAGSATTCSVATCVATTGDRP